MNKNNGLDWARELHEQSDEDWVFGTGSSQGLALIPEEERESYLPEGEVQRGVEDFMDCATRAAHNILEASFTYLYRKHKLKHWQWLRDNGYVTPINKVEFSDRFTAILSGTTRGGNSLKAPLESIRKNGLIPKWKLPKKEDMTWEQYHDPSRVTKELRNLGLEFAKRFTINYERVYEQNFSTLLPEDMLDVAGYAWEPPTNGEYPRTDNQPNHAFVVFKNKYFAYDNYEEGAGDFIKKLTENYNFLDYGYRVYFSSENTITQSPFSSRIYAIFQNLKRLGIAF